MEKNKVKKLFSRYLLNTYKRVGPVFVRGKGSWLWDEAGNRYLDLFPGWGVSILGHCHPRIVKVITEQAHKLIHLPNNLYQAEQAHLAKEIVASSFPAKVFFANSGAEAVEGAIKLSRLFGKSKRRYELITMKDSFHGRTFAALSATSQKRYKDPFRPILPSFKEVELNDLKDFKAALTRKTVGVMLELIQGEGGINVADNKYVMKLKEYCEQHRLLFILDEVQSGMGRTGKLFCYQHYAISPDIMVLAKGLGAGVPISAIVAKPHIAKLIEPGMHASTFGGLPLASRVGREVFAIIREEKILGNVCSKGNYLYGGLVRLKEKFSFIKEVRGRGLMLGMELDTESYPIFLKALRNKLLINSTHTNVLRIMPALNVTKEELDRGLDILEGVFNSF